MNVCTLRLRVVRLSYRFYANLADLNRNHFAKMCPNKYSSIALSCHYLFRSQSKLFFRKHTYKYEKKFEKFLLYCLPID